MHRSSWFLALILCGASITVGQDIQVTQDIQETIENSTPIAAFSAGQSRVFEMKQGDLVRVSGKRTGSAAGIFGIEAYVYNADKSLVAKDDPDTDQAYFEWKAPADQSFYVLVRNISPVDGAFSIIVLRGAKAGVAIGNAEFATVKVYYATNRVPAAGNGGSAPYYLADSQQGESYAQGSALVTIPRDHQLGELEGPAIYRLEFTADPAKHVALSKVVPEGDANKFFADIRDRVSGTPRKEAFVFVHGFNVSFEDALRRTAQLSYDLGYAGAAIAFSWPSQGSSLAYYRDVTTADTSAAALRAFLVDLSEKSGAATIHLIAHSMGNRVLGRALETMAARPITDPHFKEIALLAPDVDAELLRQMSAAIRIRAERVTLYSSTHDEALRLSSKLAGKPRAGQKVLFISGIQSIDASSAKTNMLDFSHSYFGDSSSVLGDLFRLLQGDPPEARFALERVDSAAGIYWRFKRFAR
jgi:esterase/lipase superfamily enzyme